ncbi:hypothetical protein ACP6JC_004218 [Aspergillus fumigatus]
MRPLSILLVVSGALALNPLHPVRIPNNNTLVSELTTDIVSDPLAKRWTCPSTCSTNICCENGLCVWSLSDVCCGSYFCNSGESCCGTGCMPRGADCCGVQGYCPSGERCMTINGKLGCCPNGDCSKEDTVNYYTEKEYTTTYDTTTYTADVLGDVLHVLYPVDGFDSHIDGHDYLDDCLGESDGQLGRFELVYAAVGDNELLYTCQCDESGDPDGCDGGQHTDDRVGG